MGHSYSDTAYRNYRIAPTDTTLSFLSSLIDVFAKCPKCKAIQTLQFHRGNFVPTRKFTQRDGHIYHDCGSSLPCELFTVKEGIGNFNVEVRR